MKVTINMELNDKLPSCPTCPRCNVPLVTGKVQKTASVSSPDFLGDPMSEGCTTNEVVVPGQLVDCWKCPQCGYSKTK